MTTTAVLEATPLQLFAVEPLPGDAEVRFIGTCGGCKTTRSTTVRRPVRCCGGFVPMAKVSGTLSVKHRCNAECMFARGPRCVCGCAGRNHGRGWLPELEDGMVPA